MARRRSTPTSPSRRCSTCMPRGPSPRSWRRDEVVYRYIKSIGKGVLKVMSKMGISTYQSYCGAQIFDAIGLSSEFVHRFFFGTSTTHRGRRPRRDRRGDGAPAPGGLRRGSGAAARARCRRRIRLPPARRGPHVDAGGGRAAAARRARQGRRDLPAIRQPAERPGAAELRDPRPLPHQDRGGDRPRAGADRGGRAGGGDRQALLDRRDELRLDLARGARDAGDRHEPHRRQVEHRRGRRGIGAFPPAAERQFQALGDQAGGLGPLRRHDGVSRQLRHDADQDRARARSPAKAASSPATRSTRRSPRCGIRRRASA